MTTTALGVGRRSFQILRRLGIDILDGDAVDSELCACSTPRFDQKPFQVGRLTPSEPRHRRSRAPLCEHAKFHVAIRLHHGDGHTQVVAVGDWFAVDIQNDVAYSFQSALLTGAIRAYIAHQRTVRFFVAEGLLAMA